MNCRRVTNSLSAYVDGELTGVEMLEIRRHLSECSECAEEYESIRFVKHTVAQLGTVTPREGFSASILRTLDEVSIPTCQRIINKIARFAHRKLSPVAAALAASGLALVILSAGGMDGIQQENGGEPAVARAPFGAQVQAVGFFPGLDDTGVYVPQYEPVRVADQTPDLEDSSIHLVALTSR